MRTISDIRHDNLLELLKRFATLQAFADKVERSNSQISQLKNQSAHSKTGQPRRIDATFARHIERKLELEPGWMDTDHKLAQGWPFRHVSLRDYLELNDTDKEFVEEVLSAAIVSRRARSAVELGFRTLERVQAGGKVDLELDFEAPRSHAVHEPTPKPYSGERVSRDRPPVHGDYLGGDSAFTDLDQSPVSDTKRKKEGQREPVAPGHKRSSSK